MALIKCPECSSEISDKSSSCPKCGAPVVVHEWRCLKCGNMISEKPCSYCNGKSSTASSTSAEIGGTNTSTPAFVKKTSRNIRILITLLAVTAGIILFAVVSQNGGKPTSSSQKSTNSHEKCRFCGYADPNMNLSNLFSPAQVPRYGYEPVYYNQDIGYHFH